MPVEEAIKPVEARCTEVYGSVEGRLDEDGSRGRDKKMKQRAEVR